MSEGEFDDASDVFPRFEYPGFTIMLWRSHPSAGKFGPEKIAGALPDLREAVAGAAEFMLGNEATSLVYGVTIDSEVHDIEVRLSFPYVRGKGYEEEVFRGRKRVVRVELLDDGCDEERWAGLSFARVLNWDLGPVFECDDDTW